MRKEPEPQPSIRMVDHALKYARMGWNIFPLGINAKVPFKGSKGLREATTDQVQITQWWTEHSQANIGLQTGAASGIIIIDLDPRNGSQESLIELEKRYGKLPSTLLVRTPRNGIHRYFKHPQDGQEYRSTVQLDHLSGIDVRGEGGYALLPPSTLFGGKASYKFVKESFPIAKTPDWLLSLLKRQEATIAPQPVNYSPNGQKWLDEALARASEGSRNQIGFWLSLQLRDDGINRSEAEAILRAYAARVPQGKDIYRESEALNSVRSAYRRSRRDPARRTH